jgi:hypothetical protein
MFFAINYALFLLAVSSSVSSHSFQIPLEKSLQTKEWQWVDIKPSRDLVWHDCFAGFKCARLDVPLDWLAHSDEARVVPAIIKLLATDLKYYKGPVFINPGGPGGSGIWSLKRSGKAFQRSQEQVTISSVLILEAVSRLVHVKRRNIS